MIVCVSYFCLRMQINKERCGKLSKKLETKVLKLSGLTHWQCEDVLLVSSGAEKHLEFLWQTRDYQMKKSKPRLRVIATKFVIISKSIFYHFFLSIWTKLKNKYCIHYLSLSIFTMLDFLNVDLFRYD